ncbi:PREDICTED: cytochrome c oxidase subunit 7C, mitochondrial-like [Bactrocera latifrons]|uniref:Cytochrome c oxidase subunit 7C, mitochondrial n=1 Tax=Bactrocera dorsalis TaxID=27457 RepID=A0A6I9VG35_BACDO|nr:cytochrome c oxidase subunit 7C, mitochondrial-like [Zeugodacus cucurbitae]XP_011177846.1 cytochrome c oxidase subunit 7C, mitochondrial-like [Zeugodacus cucurbitae]XP_011208789.1 cytochrome c oxidase subunit 7C, mitochondrial [Bactrocera dorsalis]XP_018798217.1 PREDICTED: cytochrome c oxidase subunit 7C, mitochondrial-like [Bactrocera latifrons]XP_039953075.1 cytochrome c oxidase subunit 7C, mitochondrial-like [Bactrocera tryoni]XP_049308268.1 cytochrome c oxidase subunit 7C, mitochondrial
MLGRTGLLARNITQSLVRHHSHGGIPGENLPFGLNNRYKLTAYFILFFGSGLAAPFLVVRHQLLKK